jgi:hypothetical protein
MNFKITACLHSRPHAFGSEKKLGYMHFKITAYLHSRPYVFGSEKKLGYKQLACF